MQVRLSEKSGSRQHCELAMHTYFCVSDIHRIEISGLERARYIDKLDGATEKPAIESVIRFREETDRVYRDTADPCVLHDPQWNRKIMVSKTGSRSTVIWNPWVAKSQRMPDFGDHEWLEMVCIETANIGPNQMQLAPGDVAEMTVELSVECPETQ